ncbi:AbrB/MazE/SpoVT family DNA-binding domain-containing protein [Candidatus Woesearchaeota archaeon]|nr:AbrB/MazE/SpoVT family DNA-binding domain-containing protein [Candidatus Woesearchaeota archaeon]MBI2661812.1 AbrB/MazE/SpoVT family DNA-binding domain-containing protein [Candidatus Woesearchaeota archaeon]
MIEITKVSTKGQVVIPQDIRKDLGLITGTSVLVTKMNDFVLLKKVSIPDVKREFEQLAKWGSRWAKNKGIKSEEDVMRIIHQGRGVKSA